MKISAKQSKAAACLVTGMSIKEIATCVGVSCQSISRWKTLPEFSAYVEDLLRRSEAESTSQLRALRVKAVSKLAGLLDHENPNVLLRAADLLLTRPIVIRNNQEGEGSGALNVQALLRAVGVVHG